MTFSTTSAVAGPTGQNTGDSAQPSQPRNISNRKAVLAIVTCWLLVVFDGYDLIVYGTVQSSLLAIDDWGLTPTTMGTIGSLAFVGMMIGALGAGRLADVLGRRRTILACSILFSTLTILCAFAPNPLVFGALRLLAGIGLGGLVPSANAMVAELVPDRWRSTMATLMMSGVPIGGSIAAVTGIWVIPAFGWEAMFLIAVIALVVVVPMGFRYLPETLSFKHRSGPGARRGSGFGQLLRAPYARASVLFAVASLAILFAWYGLGTWLPSLMEQAGYDLGSALTFALALNLGAVAGSVVTAWAGDRFGAAPAAAAAALVAGIGLAVIMTTPPVGVVYAMLILAGVGTHGTAALLIAAVANHYPERLRGTALGWAMGMGRIGAVAAPQVGGLLLASGLGVNSNFLVFALGAGLAAVLFAVITFRVKPVADPAEQH
ncbi:aromatic acid/H+ symport family MFS transporter [Paeniglutamicibacter sp. ZC-3]|jgi:AAHS family benzoate transporter-like MFS transporter|uniref:MFS transporter n=1 Tax=unclassified Paeniglutamicibacter TaxID=2639426 RepID=UPI0021F71AA1|nr:aromatic acid/H+ symport family MFS transporter [Paeniglutamicibacter sp. ZC-3]MCV9994145.1 aromatic acid/H+ symport family MFS transporter [Paeniglutamicibacter sp. ZC-3]